MRQLVIKRGYHTPVNCFYLMYDSLQLNSKLFCAFFSLSKTIQGLQIKECFKIQGHFKAGLLFKSDTGTELLTFNNARLGLCVAVWLHRSKSMSAGLGCCGLGWKPALSVTRVLLKAAYEQTRRYLSETVLCKRFKQVPENSFSIASITNRIWKTFMPSDQQRQNPRTSMQYIEYISVCALCTSTKVLAQSNKNVLKMCLFSCYCISNTGPVCIAHD